MPLLLELKRNSFFLMILNWSGIEDQDSAVDKIGFLMNAAMDCGDSRILFSLCFSIRWFM